MSYYLNLKRVLKKQLNSIQSHVFVDDRVIIQWWAGMEEGIPYSVIRFMFDLKEILY